MSAPAAPQPAAGAAAEDQAPEQAEDRSEEQVDDEESPPWPLPRDPARRAAPAYVRVGLAALAALAVALIATGLWRAAPERNLAVPTGRLPAATSSITGTVTAVRTGRHVCFAVATRSGRMLLVVPRGWTADADLRLLDPLGRVRLIDGTRVRLAGSVGAGDHVTGCPGVGRPWFATGIRPA